MFNSKKPYSSVTVSIERLTNEQFEEDDLSGIPDLVEVIKLQATGPTEAARAIRKKLKYGSVHRQLRALTLLDGLIQNGGTRIHRTLIDEPLLERLRVCATSDLSSKEVRERCKDLFGGWAREYRKTPGLEKVAALYKQLPRRKQVVTQEQSKVLKETEQDPFEGDEDEIQEQQAATSSRAPATDPSPPPAPKTHKPSKSSSSAFGGSIFGAPAPKSKKDKKGGKGKSKPFNLQAEKDKMKNTIAESSVASVNLLNAMQRINREQERVSENESCLAQFERCKLLRRHILRYIQHVETEEWLGALIQANDQLVTSLMTFEQVDRSIDADSDSDDELAEQAHAYRMLAEKGKSADSGASDLAGLKISSASHDSRPPAPPRPAQQMEESESEGDIEEEEEGNPFGDSNAVETPAQERDEPKW